MPSLSAYSSGLDYSYAPGFFPGIECLTHRPEKVRRVLLHSSAAGREGADRLLALAEKLGVRVEDTSILFSVVALSVHIPINNVGVFHLIHTLSSTYFL